MVKLWVKTLQTTYNASGAAAAARQGNVVMIVDVIDMSTTSEAVLEAGAITVLGASPDNNTVPVTVNPEKIGYFAGKKALKHDTTVIVAAEPRLIQNEKDRLKEIQQVLKGIERAGAELEEVVPNIGREVVELADFANKIVVVVSPSGGTAYDAAYNYGAPEVITGTIARTNNMNGSFAARVAAERAIEKALKFKRGITVVAASSNSMEDVQACQYICQEIINNGFLKMN
ncbi:hypothetical protein GM661_11180 [Iocasia frigidifontis]|uniref:Uncharacterized protein n=1 Tax=Iocasia fonsfrigidae TaxID=2682810 RepID=A0A8A7KAL0_9FIRM|nr:hypothetical protein [Iocasia fonsfrigidae]QTL98491.1 hypothetical protein GM661_11180 [Iocasia fonsfrigidae]